MSRITVGLVNLSVTNFNWQLPVCNGCLISGPFCKTSSRGFCEDADSGIAALNVRGRAAKPSETSEDSSLSFGGCRGESQMTDYTRRGLS